MRTVRTRDAVLTHQVRFRRQWPAGSELPERDRGRGHGPARRPGRRGQPSADPARRPRPCGRVSRRADGDTQSRPRRGSEATMTEFSHGDPVTGDDDEAGRLWAIADELSLAGLVTHLRRTRGVLDLTATMRQPGRDARRSSSTRTATPNCATGPIRMPDYQGVAYAITSALAAVTPHLARSAHAASRSMPARRQADHRLRWRGHRMCGRSAICRASRPTDRTGAEPRMVSPRESDPVNAELRQRMEDLSPRPPIVPLQGRRLPQTPGPGPVSTELPSPGDPNYQPDSPSEPQADLAADGCPGGDASPEANGTSLSF